MRATYERAVRPSSPIYTAVGALILSALFAGVWFALIYTAGAALDG
jgi:hypothetical protein